MCHVKPGKLLLKLVFSGFLLLLSGTFSFSTAQKTNNELLCKKWSVVKFLHDEADETYIFENTSLDFQTNGKFEMLDAEFGTMTDGTWNFEVDDTYLILKYALPGETDTITDVNEIIELNDFFLKIKSRRHDGERYHLEETHLETAP